MRLPFRTILCNHYKRTCSFLSLFNPILLKHHHHQPPLPPPTTLQMNTFSCLRRRRVKDKDQKLLVIMGPTGSGKSGLSIKLGTYFPSEIINSDKIQLYKGLDITTNKIPLIDRLNIPHHLLGEIDPKLQPELTPLQYRARASSIISSITSRRKLPLLVGGSNSLIHALLSVNPDSDPFSGSDPDPVSSELRYKCCFLWIDVSLPVLNEYLIKRVDDMLDSGMVNELADFYESEVDELAPNIGLTKAIGVPEFERYFKCDDQVRRGVYDEAVKNIKDNTCQLAKIQMEKIQRLRNSWWGLHRIDGTDTFRAVLDGSKNWSDIWEKQVVYPSIKIVKNFLEE
ncbi:adenylate isopentenyltransferase-like [Chenopodium quinoa]|uniref:adenylate isopentenyltransferase-like n=1 Tax=Chenopodium quinoa TaxID=63459 RepID=UPI000B776057|nr:adenylate isopentenyltransferase-like [Chenopodium quinoa]